MNLAFSCPSCGVSGLVDESFAGRQVRCKQCQYRFPIPAPGTVEPDGYGLDVPSRPSTSIEPSARLEAETSVFSPTRNDEPTGQPRRKPRRPSSPPSKKARRPEGPGFAWGTWLIRGGVALAVVLILVALIAPRGLILSGSTLLVLGMVLILVGYGAGAYGAFSEDFLYGFLYLVFPIYTGYYVVTRWEDLSRWFLCSTAGVGLSMVGLRLLLWGGIES